MSDRLKKLAVTGLAMLLMTFGVLLGAAPQANADTGAYAYVSSGREYGILRFYFDFGIPRWVTSNTGVRVAAKEGCANYLGYKLGLRWWMWPAPQIVCSWAVDRFWKPYGGMSVCGRIPLHNVYSTRLWSC